MGSIIGGVGLLLLALFMFVGYMGADIQGGPGATVLALVIAVGLPAAGGAALLARHFRKPGQLSERKDELRRQTLEAEVLRIARAHGAKLTVIEVVGELAVTPEEAKAALDSLARQEIAELEITDSGVIVYAFHDVARLSEKSRSKGILDD
jgi:hypothetical protein